MEAEKREESPITENETKEEIISGTEKPSKEVNQKSEKDGLGEDAKSESHSTGTTTPKKQSTNTKGSGGSSSSKKGGSSKCASDKTCVRLMLVNGKRSDFLLNGIETTIKELKELVFSNWPEDWEGDAVESVQALRIIHGGKFREDEVKLSSLGCKMGSVAIMHLVPRPGK
eukprot:Nk52_evm1s1771 gene=Nk52_evmTU1s1771